MKLIDQNCTKAVISPSLLTASTNLKSELLRKPKKSLQGLAIAVTIIALWIISLIFLMSQSVTLSSLGWIPWAMLWQTFLYTGLFITAHDAMHGAVYSQRPKINHAIGSLALKLYGLFSYRELLEKHHYHHRHPATELDPDFHDGIHQNLFSWYFFFMKNYWSWPRLLALILLFHSCYFLFQIPHVNLTLFWAIPSLLSSVQLFFFGTYLTHREPEGGYKNPHRSVTNSLPLLLSFLTCYHFGYHREHHEYPHLAWWQLPIAHRHLRSLA